MALHPGSVYRHCLNQAKQVFSTTCQIVSPRKYSYTFVLAAFKMTEVGLVFNSCNQGAATGGSVFDMVRDRSCVGVGNGEVGFFKTARKSTPACGVEPEVDEVIETDSKSVSGNVSGMAGMFPFDLLVTRNIKR